MCYLSVTYLIRVLTLYPAGLKKVFPFFPGFLNLEYLSTIALVSFLRHHIFRTYSKQSIWQLFHIIDWQIILQIKAIKLSPGTLQWKNHWGQHKGGIILALSEYYSKTVEAVCLQ